MSTYLRALGDTLQKAVLNLNLSLGLGDTSKSTSNLNQLLPSKISIATCENHMQTSNKYTFIEMRPRFENNMTKLESITKDRMPQEPLNRHCLVLLKALILCSLAKFCVQACHKFKGTATANKKHIDNRVRYRLFIVASGPAGRGNERSASGHGSGADTFRTLSSRARDAGLPRHERASDVANSYTGL
jgi:hypothetical protein